MSVQAQFRIADSIVHDINLKIKGNRLIRKVENQMDPVGGGVSGYFNPDQTIVYLYSSYGGEFERDEKKAYYFEGKMIYAEYRFFWLYRDKNGTGSTEKLVAEKLFYLLESESAKDTLTFLNTTLKPPYADMEFYKSSIPTGKNIVANALKMQANLNANGE